MIQVNLLPKEEQVADPRFAVTMPRPGFWVPLAVGLGVLLPLGGLVAMQRARIQSVTDDIQQAEVESRRLRPQIDRIRQLETEREQLNMRLAVIQDLCRNRYLPVETMDQLSDQVPENLWLTRVEETAPGQLTLEGLAFSNLMVAELMTNMEQSDLFDGVGLVVAERSSKESRPELPVLAFTLTARIKP